MATITELETLKTEAKTRFEWFKKEAEELEINEYDLDGEALKTPKLHSKWLGYLGDEAVNAKRVQSHFKRIYLERWKYYSGTQTDQYYATHGQVHQKILKTDINIYLDADKFIILMKELVEIQEQLVMFLERSVKEIGARSFHIKSAIEWRKFQSGA